MSLIASYLISQPTFKLLRVLLLSGKARGLRELVDLAMIPLGTGQSALRKLEDARVVSSKLVGQKKLYSLEIDEDEKGLLSKLLENRAELQGRASQLGKTAQSNLAWMLEMHELLKVAKK